MGMAPFFTPTPCIIIFILVILRISLSLSMRTAYNIIYIMIIFKIHCAWSRSRSWSMEFHVPLLFESNFGPLPLCLVVCAVTVWPLSPLEMMDMLRCVLYGYTSAQLILFRISDECIMCYAYYYYCYHINVCSCFLYGWVGIVRAELI